MNIKAILAASIVVAASAAAMAVCDIGLELDKKENWTADPIEFNIDHKEAGFRFAGQNRDCCVSMGEGKVEFKGIPVAETRVYFADGAIRRTEISVYNKGDLEPITKDEFLSLIDRVRKQVNPEGAKAPEALKEKLQGGAYRRTQRWEKTFPAAEMTWGWKEEEQFGRKEVRPEFIRLTLTGVADAASARKATAGRPRQTAKGSRTIRENVQKNANGDVYIANVPMVNQGQKGYCAAATSERVLRYYGLDVDEHEIAQLAGTSAQGGTEAGAMVAAVTKVGNKMGLKKEDVIAAQSGTTWEQSDFYKMLQLYNQAAKAAKEPQIDWHEYESGLSINVGKMMEAMKAKVLKQARAKLTGPQKRFHDEIRKQVNAGVPLFWSVTLGFYPEPEIPQAMGGHMRLVIGYNDKTKELLYTDSWGAGHELKRMPEDWAWTITTCMIFLRPKQ